MRAEPIEMTFRKGLKTWGHINKGLISAFFTLKGKKAEVILSPYLQAGANMH